MAVRVNSSLVTFMLSLPVRYTVVLSTLSKLSELNKGLPDFKQHKLKLCSRTLFFRTLNYNMRV